MGSGESKENDFGINLFCVQNKAIILLRIPGSVIGNFPHIERDNLLSSNVVNLDYSQCKDEALLDGWDKKNIMFNHNTHLEERKADESVDSDKDIKYEEYDINDIPQKHIDSTVVIKDELSIDTVSSRLQCIEFPPGTSTNEVGLDPLSNWLGTIVGTQKNELSTNPTLTKDTCNKKKLLLKQCSSEHFLPNKHNDADIKSSINRGRSEHFSSEDAVISSSGINNSEVTTNNDNSKRVSLDLVCNSFFAGRKGKSQKKKDKLVVKENNDKKGAKSSYNVSDSFIQTNECNLLPISQSIPIPSSDGKITILRRDNKISNTGSREQSNVTYFSGDSKVKCNDFFNTTISNNFEQYKSIMMSELKDIVRIEIQEFLLPTILNTISEHLEELVIKLIRPSIVKCVTELFKTHTYEIVESVSKNVKDPVSIAFHQSMSE